MVGFNFWVKDSKDQKKEIFLEAIKTFQNPSVLRTPPFEKSPIKPHRFCVLPPLKNHPSNPIGFVYSPLWKITHQKPSVLCAPPFEKSPIKNHRFCVLPPLKNHPPKPIGFMYFPPLKNHCFWQALISGERLFRGGRLFRRIPFIPFISCRNTMKVPLYRGLGAVVRTLVIRNFFAAKSTLKDENIFNQVYS